MPDGVVKMVTQYYSLRWCFIGVVVALLVPSMPDAAFAQSATPGSVIVLEEIVVEGRRMDEEDLAREKLEAIPGGTG